MDGSKVYVPTGWWISGEESGVLVLDADNGELIKHANGVPTLALTTH